MYTSLQLSNEIYCTDNCLFSITRTNFTNNISFVKPENPNVSFVKTLCTATIVSLVTQRNTSVVTFNSFNF